MSEERLSPDEAVLFEELLLAVLPLPGTELLASGQCRCPVHGFLYAYSAARAFGGCMWCVRVVVEWAPHDVDLSAPEVLEAARVMLMGLLLDKAEARA